MTPRRKRSVRLQLRRIAVTWHHNRQKLRTSSLRSRLLASYKTQDASFTHELRPDLLVRHSFTTKGTKSTKESVTEMLDSIFETDVVEVDTPVLMLVSFM